MNNLVDYSSSDNENEIADTEKQRFYSFYCMGRQWFFMQFPYNCRISPLPLPQILNRKEILECDENKQDHEGRIRSISHERGNWASYIYIICKIFNIIFQYSLI
jgi:hypothetical protein